MSAGTRFRTSRYNAFYIGNAFPFKATCYEQILGVWEPIDLTSYESVRLQIFDTDAASTLRQDIPLTVLTDAASKVNNSAGTAVACRVSEQNVVISGAAGDVMCKLVGKVGSTFTQIDKPWKATVYPYGPTT